MYKEIDISEEEIKKWADEYVNNIVKKRNIVLSNEYLKWITDCLDRYDGHISDDPDEGFLYDDESIDRSNTTLLSYLLMEVSSLAKEQKVLSVVDKENPFETERYVVKIFDRYFEMSEMVGQGSITFIKSCEKPDYSYVVLKN